VAICLPPHVKQKDIPVQPHRIDADDELAENKSDEIAEDNNDATSSISALRGRAKDDKNRSSGASRACGHPGGKLPPPRWPQAHTMGMPGRGFSGLSGVCGAKSTIDPDRYGRITPTMALKFLSF